MKRTIDWLNKEVKEWTRESLISEENAAKILARYRSDEPRVNWATAIFAAFGATLIALGIISLLAFNWEALTRGVKAVIAFSLLFSAQALAIYAKLKKPQIAAYAEGSSLFLLFAFTGALAIIAQTYHLGGSLIDFTKVVIALTLPLIYIFNAKGASAILFIAIVSLICFETNAYESQIVGWLYFVVWAAWYVYRLVKKRDSHITLAFNLLFMFGALAIMNAELRFNYSYDMLYHALFFGSFWLASALLYPRETKFFSRPAEEIAKLAIALMLLIGSSETISNFYRFDNYESLSTFYLFCMPYFALFGFFVVKLRDRLCELIVPIAPFVFYIVLVANTGDASKWLFSLACLVGGASFIYGGIRRLNTTLAYQGIVWLAALFAIKFFDSELGFIEKGIGFILVGVAFLAASFFIGRYIKEAK
ncbi:MAG: DUF2157 domain-containing protein [Helicobacteraceae bacterium]|jgi:uncharacterized membrane protein|nr:DUF2157 domain-containing protein [Helicobacteraceae bacterium]